VLRLCCCVGLPVCILSRGQTKALRFRVQNAPWPEMYLRLAANPPSLTRPQTHLHFARLLACSPACLFAYLPVSPGVGKTTLAHVVARHAGYRVVELNASDDRSAELLKQRVLAATQMQEVRLRSMLYTRFGGNRCPVRLFGCCCPPCGN